MGVSSITDLLARMFWKVLALEAIVLLSAMAYLCFVAADHRALAHAITAQDPAEVMRRIPQAGALDERHGDQTYLSFALYQAFTDRDSVKPGGTPQAGEAIVQALLDAGANPNLASGSGTWPLALGIGHGASMTARLLAAGADPNRPDSAGRPVWWEAFSARSDQGREALALLLNRGADLSLRHPEGGPVGWATYRKDWVSVLMLVERGARLRGESQFGQPVERALADAAQGHASMGKPIPDEIARLLALAGMSAPAAP